MNDLVVLKGKKVVCDSLEVAEKFQKQHGHVLRHIENLKKIFPILERCFTKTPSKTE